MQARLFPHCVEVAQQVGPDSPQQTLFWHLSPVLHVPCPTPVQLEPSPVIATQVPALQAKPSAQSPGALQVLLQTGGGWMTAELQ